MNGPPPPPQTPPRNTSINRYGRSSKLVPSSYMTTTPSKYSTPCGGGGGTAARTTQRYHLPTATTTSSTTTTTTTTHHAAATTSATTPSRCRSTYATTSALVTPSRTTRRTPYRQSARPTTSTETPYHTPMSSIPSKRACSTSSPSTTGIKSFHARDESCDNDRFIPSRRRLNMDLCRRALLRGAEEEASKLHHQQHQQSSPSGDASSPQPYPSSVSEETPLQKEYKRRMLSTLCNVPLDQLTKDGEPVGLLPFGSGNHHHSGRGSSSSSRHGNLHSNYHNRSNRPFPAEGRENFFPAPVNPFEHDTLRQCKMGRTLTTAGNDRSSWDEDAFSASYYSAIGGTRSQRKVPTSPIRILDAPDIVDDYYLNLISWSPDNILAVALAQSVYLWNATSGDIQHLVTVESANDYITSVCWCPTSSHSHLIAVGTNLAQLHLYDGHSLQKITTVAPGSHLGRVSALAWNPSQAQWLTSGARDSLICNYDLRQAQSSSSGGSGGGGGGHGSMLTSQYRGHEQEVCGLKWNEDGTCLASGGNENYLCLWDAQMSQRGSNQNRLRRSTSSSSSSASSSLEHLPRLTLRQHKAAVKALDWCPFHRGLLASGGGTADRTIKFWNSSSGAVLHSVDTGSQVCSVVWSPLSGARELCSSHGYSENQLILWKYPTMTKLQELKGHSARVLNMEKSPDGTSVVSAAADETLRFWNVFSTPHESSLLLSTAAGASSSSSSSSKKMAMMMMMPSAKNDFLSSLGVPTIR
ncbi:hypothetical protein ACA910_003713 [Epithemia clementina (nom. ined.)]